MSEEQMVVMIVTIVGSVGVIGTIAWAYVERLKIRRGADPRQLDTIGDRLARIENAIDAMSVEVERISEGQRFATKLLADRSPDVASPGAPRRS
jgi:hypothetical protein